MTSSRRAGEETRGGEADGAPKLSGLEMEMRTRDEDALVYEAFFTDFQTRVENKTYADAFSTARGQRALEVGCGTGRTLDVFTAPAVFGIDLSRKELLLARERFGDRAVLIQASATHLPFRDGVFDQILCAGVMHHLPDEGIRTLAAEEMARVSTPTARVVVGTHGYPWVVKRMFPKEVINHALFWHRFDADELEQFFARLLAPCNVTTKGICHLPRWRVGNKLGGFGVWLDGMLSRVPGLKNLTGVILVSQIDRTAQR